jgi:hypothetical protein
MLRETASESKFLSDRARALGGLEVEEAVFAAAGAR